MKRIKPNIKFVGLHGHSTAGSPGDAIGYPQEHMEYVWKNGMDAFALTDHGNMNGLGYQILHAKKMMAEGRNFKPIFGTESYFIDSISDWKDLYEEHKSQSKVKSAEKTSGIIMENEDETKQKKFNPLNTRSHLVLLAQNEQGLKNLYKLVSSSFESENFYRYPRMDFEMLQRYSEGIIASSACLGSRLAKPIWNNQDGDEIKILDEMVEVADKFHSIFGDRFYLELQWNAIPEQHRFNKYLIQVSKQLGIPLVSTADSHYPNPQLWKDRTLYKKMAWLSRSNVDTSLPEVVDELGYELYPKNGDQMWEDYKRYSELHGVSYDDTLVMESLERTHEIAHEKIEAFFPDNSIKLPSFVVPEGVTATQSLASSCIRSLKEKGLHIHKEYVDRLKYELEVIHKRDFSKYFLTMKALVDKAENKCLAGPGRGSAAGSLSSYLLGITQVDPIRWNLQFERFLRPSDASYPDIDWDISNPMEFKEFLIEEWGDKSVVPISNFNTLKLRSLIKDISKFYDIEFKEVNDVTGVMLEEALPEAKKKHGMTAGVYSPTFEEMKEYSGSLKNFLGKYPHVENHINNLYGQVRSQSRHAGGVLISENLDEQMPLVKSRGVLQTPWSEGQNVRHLEPLGFIKFDILGLATLEMIEDCIRNILKRHKGIESPTFAEIKSFYNEHLHPDKINFDDQVVYEDVYHSGKKWFNIFQFTESGVQDFCMRAKPRSLSDLSTITAIYRPGPLSAGVDKKYVEFRNGKEIEFLHPIIKEETEETGGNVVFQEQIATIVSKIGKDINLDEGNLLRKLLVKKGTGDNKAKFDSIYSKYLEGAREKGIEQNIAKEIWCVLENFAKYGFCSAHSCSYAIISFQCAWLAHYYQVEWMAAFLGKEVEKKDEDKYEAITKVKAAGIAIKKPCVNTSTVYWEISKDGKSLIQPLTSIKGLGEKAANEIIKNRPFNTVEDILFNDDISYRALNKRCLDVLCRSGAMDELRDERFSGTKHFWSCIAVDRPKTLKKLGTNIDLYEAEGSFSKNEQIENTYSLLGTFPINLIMSDKVKSSIVRYGVSCIGNYDTEKAEEIVWFIPTEVRKRRTSNGRPYIIVGTTDSSFRACKIKCWGYGSEVKDFSVNGIYIGKIKYDSKWGFSMTDSKKNLKRIG